MVETQATISCGGTQVNPGDMVGCDDDGVIVVPAEVADEVAVHARAILLADMRVRRKHYEALGITPDSSVDHEAVEEYYAASAADDTFRGPGQVIPRHTATQEEPSGRLHPLIAPDVMPATIWRLKNRNMISGGIVISRMFMNSRLYWVLNWLWKL